MIDRAREIEQYTKSHTNSNTMVEINGDAVRLSNPVIGFACITWEEYCTVIDQVWGY